MAGGHRAVKAHLTGEGRGGIELAPQLLPFAQGPPGVIPELGPRVGQAHPAPVALQQELPHLVLQALHAITFGLAYAATASFIARRVHESVAARAQALAATLATAAMAATTLASGALYETLGAGGYLAMAGLAALGAALVAASWASDLEDRAGAV